ncbi:MAG: 50S ribosomal protein L3 N(5)-glutamine methyltransferase [Betaproteobacteria bacterium]|nr:MAG: 50S ribosomal protein L3 N(5)-glutamine methyltransferase [Betaproteobacteria bacterium]
MRTVRDLVRFGVTRFEAAKLSYGHGSDNALDEAAYLVSHALHLPIERLDAFMDACVLPQEADAVLALFQRRVTERLPAAYLTHEAWIGRHRFYVDERVIVPRSYIGHWLGGDLAPWIEHPEAIENVLELCTGSGCLAVLLAEAFPAARVDAVDISSDALQVARHNVAMYGLQQRVRLLEGDLFSGLSQRRYDLVAANPPYVTAAAMQDVPPEYRHEPRIALAGGEDGLDVVRRILAQAYRHLARDGLLIMEVGHARSRMEAAFPRLPFTWLEIDGVDDAVLLLRHDQLPARGARR